jgi:hypothetical protein
MRARLLSLLVAGVLITGSGLPAAQAMEKRGMRNQARAGIVVLRNHRPMVAERRLLPFRTFEQAHARPGQSLALCCTAAFASPDAAMIVVTENAVPQAASPEPEQPAAARPAVKPHDAPSTETVAGVTIMRGSVATTPNR